MALQTRGIKAVMLSSAQKDPAAEDRAARGEFSLIFMAPEKARTTRQRCHWFTEGCPPSGCAELRTLPAPARLG